MSRILFEDQRPDLTTQPSRADVACFVGLVRLAPAIASGVEPTFGIPPVVRHWLKQQGWESGPFARQWTQLLDVPVPVENYAGFTAMFDGVETSSPTGSADYLAAAVRSFFAQGGKRCYVVRMGDPISTAPSIPAASIAAAKQRMLQAVLIHDDHEAGDQRTWHGTGHLAGLLDVSYLMVPDLPILCASRPAPIVVPQSPAPSAAEHFVECGQRTLTREHPIPNVSQAPRLSPADYGVWAQSVATIVSYLTNGTLHQEPHLREIQFVAAFPLPRDDDGASIAALDKDLRNVIQQYMPERPFDDVKSPNLSSAFLQLVYPWLKTTGSYALLESLEPPDGTLAGMLARNALKRGAFTSATKITPAEIFDVWPALPMQELKVSPKPLQWGDPKGVNSGKPLIARLSLFGFTPGGWRLLSDVTAYPGEAYRPARVNRLVSLICRAARNIGATLIFEQNGPPLWARLKRALEQLLTTAWTVAALDGATPAQAFTVRCDASTMTQNDIDNGRLVAEITFTAAATIELIRVTLALETDRTLPQPSVALAEAV
jgi:hypothetical protein